MSGDGDVRATAADTDAITVVIPARNAAATLQQQLGALDRQTGTVAFDVLLVDNGSTDDTAALARAHRSSRYTLRVVAEARPGINNARNTGIAAAADGYVLLCDADDEVTAAWVEEMAASRSAGTWSAGVVEYVGINSERTRLQWGAAERSACETSDPYIDRTFGGNCGFHRAMWAALGGFEPSLSGSGDETEFFMRAYAAGYRQQWVPGAVIRYRLRPGLRNMVRQRFLQGRRQVRMARLDGGANPTAIPDATATRRALVKLAFATPKYVWTARRRCEWLTAVSRHLGRLAGHREPPNLQTEAG